MKKKERGGGISNIDKIKEFLEDGPASINDICKKLEISWATAKSALEEMKEKEEVKEIISNPKIRIFKLSTDPAFYGVPLSKKQKNDVLFLFKTIREEWQKMKKEPLLTTTLQKIAVEVARECKNEIPVASFHYGQIVPVFEIPSFNIQTPENSLKIITLVKEQIPKHKNIATEEMEEQYEKYSMILYKAKQRVKRAILSKEFKKSSYEEVELALSNLLMSVPTDNNEPEIFSLFSDFVKEIHGLIITKTFNKNIDKINESFDVLWDLITTYLFFKDIERSIKSEKKEIYRYIKSFQLLSKKANAEERINYLRALADIGIEIKMPMDEESIEIRRILTEGVEEE